MELSENLPECFKQVQRSLQPFLKDRQEASQIRRLLASHLESHVQLRGDPLLSRPLSLVDSASIVENPSPGLRGVRREYIRAVRANLKAREEYDNIRQQHRSVEQLTSNSSQISDGPETLESFLELVKCRRKQERLRIIQDYVDMLAQKPAALASHLDPKLVLKDVESLPKVPPEVMNATASIPGSDGTDLKGLVDKLEKSVLRAKLLLKKEQKLLAKVQAGESKTVTHGGKLEALGLARNELINWIEAELAKTGETAESEDGVDMKSTGKPDKDHVESQLDLIKRQYSQYLKRRQNLIVAVTGTMETPAIACNDEGMDFVSENVVPPDLGAMSVVQPYLEELLSVSNEQKSTIQLKSHLSISLAKTLKEASHVMDRFADESHLLPAHPVPAGNLNGKGLSSFADEISSYEKPDMSHRARAWAFASNSASKATRDTISERLGDGQQSILETQRTLQKLRTLLGGQRNGEGATAVGENFLGTEDIWGQLDGQLGAIQTDD